MVVAVTLGVGLAWLAAALVLVALITVVILTGDRVEESEPVEQRREARPEVASPTSGSPQTL